MICVFLDLTEEGECWVGVFVMGQPAWNTESKFITLASSFTELLDQLRLDDDTVEMLHEDLGNRDEEEDQRMESIWIQADSAGEPPDRIPGL
ncbi:hypothetical protein F8S09_14880 [Deinococcus sp. SDU3-2]|uniref:Uncharacterized protein n=1 Tax=Deinococcus terrestris TaxID=2651870 RepID=A0A7X1TSY0_9DEIO|nr:hypothetical protein [Deinococcus terrestris]MPY67944.1 hypothetical protein [Deinococcus terrestris]